MFDFRNKTKYDKNDKYISQPIVTYIQFDDVRVSHPTERG